MIIAFYEKYRIPTSYNINYIINVNTYLDKKQNNHEGLTNISNLLKKCTMKKNRIGYSNNKITN